jgi:hypothetical protein
VFIWSNSALFKIVGKLISQKIKEWEFKEVTVGSWSYLVGNQPQKFVAPHSMGPRWL